MAPETSIIISWAFGALGGPIFEAFLCVTLLFSFTRHTVGILASNENAAGEALCLRRGRTSATNAPLARPV